jgi:hypothetical protein
MTYIVIDIWGESEDVKQVGSNCDKCGCSEENLKKLGSSDLCNNCFVKAVDYIIPNITPQLEIVKD